MKKALFVTFLIILVSSFILVGCTSQPTTESTTTGESQTVTGQTTPGTTSSQTTTSGQNDISEEKVWTMRMHHEQSETSPYHKYGHLPWVEDIAEATNGRVKIDIYPNQTLLKSSDAWEGVKTGITDLSWIFTGYFPGQFDLLDCVALPFIAPNGEVASRTAWALYEKYPEIREQSKDVKVLSVWTTEPYFFNTSSKQIRTLEDFSGMKLRMTGGPPTEMMKLLGGTPMMVPMPDVYLNMEKGVIDGLAGPAEAMTGYRFYEVAPYYTYVPTTTVWFMLVMNMDTWESLPADIQKAFEDFSGERQAIRYGGGVFDHAREEFPAIVKEAGYDMNTYTPPKDEIDRLIDIAGKPLWDNWVTNMEAKGHSNAQAILDDCLAFVDQFSQGKIDTWKDID